VVNHWSLNKEAHVWHVCQRLWVHILLYHIRGTRSLYCEQCFMTSVYCNRWHCQILNVICHPLMCIRFWCRKHHFKNRIQNFSVVCCQTIKSGCCCAVMVWCISQW
jgi:hypothetical protein